MKIFALSGFLGLPQDWDCFNCKDLEKVDWQRFSWNNLKEWGKELNLWVHSFASEREDCHKQERHLLLGYSFGGRLALHALIDHPQQWQAAIIVSAHPGLEEGSLRQKRLEEDQAWAKRFESETWSNVIKDWNAQAVFAHDSFLFERHESEYDRHILAKALRQGSLGCQDNLRSEIEALALPILWVTGDLDRRYCHLAQTLTFSHPHSCWKKINGAGHRVPWSHPVCFNQVVRDFLPSVSPFSSLYF